MRFSYRLSLLLSVACIQLAFPAVAQEDASEERQDETSSVQDTIIVEGLSLRSETTPVDVLSGTELVRRRQGTLGETLSGLPGVHMDNFGGGVSRPVIRGQTLPRIEILSDGATVYDVSSVSPDHGIITDPLLLDAIEVQRGPAATIYGGNALNGAINLIDSKIPKSLPDNGLTGAGEVRYSTGDDGLATAGRVTMGAGLFAIHVEGSTSDANNYDVPGRFGADRLKDSFAQSASYSAGASWIAGNGYIGAAYTVQEAEYGLPGHSHINGVCHTHGADLHCAAHGEFEDPFGSSDDHTAYIKLRSERVDVRADYEELLPGFEHVRFRGSYTDYKHDEIDGPALFSRYTNEVWDGRLELTHKPLLGFTGTFGVQYTDGTFTGLNVNDLHQNDYTDPSVLTLGSFVPPYDYVTENIGAFLSEHRSLGPVDLELAVRKDLREVSRPLSRFVQNIPVEDYDRLLPLLVQFFGEDWETTLRDQAAESFVENNPGAKHNPFSASFAATWNIGGGYSAALALAHTERAPNVRELYAYGNNLATNSYEVGLSQTTRASSSFPARRTDVMETAKSVNLTFRKTRGPLAFEVGLFYQDFDDYIFARLIETERETGIAHNYLIYTAADAAFKGIDGQISHRLGHHSKVTLFGDYIRASLKSEDDNLPRIPPGRLGIRYSWETGPVSADVDYYRTFGQDRIASYETKTGGYDMLGATIAYRLDLSPDRSVEFYARGTNLTDELAFVHTSFVKDQSPLRGRNILFGVRTAF